MSILENKSYDFAIRIVKCSQYLQQDKKLVNNILEDIEQLIKMLAASIKTAKESIKNEK